ncbi:hypothetical protein BU16DRAFT_580413 [Lophium mytilinum]|uniref:Uncharacterized protein n=1 Tax=Lophium mytilinum TaxID=390894 RepID=A0A6A6R1W3_9PEZI|nr:hypothetical protein BU16DRAFT_580413 [Lophium mytilinum]
MANLDRDSRIVDADEKDEATQLDAKEASLDSDLDNDEASPHSDTEDDFADAGSADESFDSDSGEDQSELNDFYESDGLGESHIESKSLDSESGGIAHALVAQLKPALITEERKKELLKWVPSQKTDSDRISFLDISLEIREMIYKEALVCEGSICFRDDLPDFHILWDSSDSEADDNKPDSSNRGANKDRPFQQLFSVCRQVYAECQKVFYSCNKFVGRPQAIHSFRDHEIKFIQSPYNALVRRVEYGIYWESLRNWPGAFGDHLSKVREWMPAAKYVQYTLRWADDLIGLDGEPSSEASLKRTATLLKAYTLGHEELPTWLDFAVRGSKEDEEHMAASVAIWRKKTADGTGLDDGDTL